MKLAIVIEGAPNSGKTSTIRELINSYGNKTLKVMKRGKNRIFLNRNFTHLKLDFYCVPASPSETNFKLSERCTSSQYDVLLVALQINGQHYLNSNAFLDNNNYYILRYTIVNKKGHQTWERFSPTDRSHKLGSRVDEIVRDIRQFITSNQII